MAHSHALISSQHFPLADVFLFTCGFLALFPLPLEQKLQEIKSLSVFFADDSVPFPVSRQCQAHDVNKFVTPTKRQQINFFSIQIQVEVQNSNSITCQPSQ